MIKRLSLSPWLEPEHEGWLDSTAQDAGQLFEVRTAYRRIVVMVDSDLIEDPTVRSSTTQGHLLTDLIQDDFVTIDRYDEERRSGLVVGVCPKRTLPLMPRIASEPDDLTTRLRSQERTQT